MACCPGDSKQGSPRARDRCDRGARRGGGCRLRDRTPAADKADPGRAAAAGLGDRARSGRGSDAPDVETAWSPTTRAARFASRPGRRGPRPPPGAERDRHDRRPPAAHRDHQHGGNFGFDALVGPAVHADRPRGDRGRRPGHRAADRDERAGRAPPPRHAASALITVTGPGGTGVSGASVELRGVDTQLASRGWQRRGTAVRASSPAHAARRLGGRPRTPPYHRRQRHQPGAAGARPRRRHHRQGRRQARQMIAKAPPRRVRHGGEFGGFAARRVDAAISSTTARSVRRDPGRDVPVRGLAPGLRVGRVVAGHR